LITVEEIEASLRSVPAELRGAQLATKPALSSPQTASHEMPAMTANFKLFDSRTAERYRGENEPIDPIGGHIPGAISTPYLDNLNPDGTFRSSEELQKRFTTLLGGTPAANTAFYCGSGVNAAHNILALQHAGLGEARLYAGSWSEWIANRQRPVAK
jgi:thiosulfate/3-mercaptopyruvate sulfurtransferase